MAQARHGEDIVVIGVTVVEGHDVLWYNDVHGSTHIVKHNNNIKQGA